MLQYVDQAQQDIQRVAEIAEEAKRITGRHLDQSEIEKIVEAIRIKDAQQNQRRIDAAETVQLDVKPEQA